MITGSNCLSHVFEFFLNISNLYVSKLYEFAEAVEPDQPELAGQLRHFAEAQAGQVLDLVQAWPVVTESLEYTKYYAGGAYRPA